MLAMKCLKRYLLLPVGVVVLAGCGSDAVTTDPVVETINNEPTQNLVIEQEAVSAAENRDGGSALPPEDTDPQELPQAEVGERDSATAQQADVQQIDVQEQEKDREQGIEPLGLEPVNLPPPPSPLTPETNPEPRVISEQEQIEIDQKTRAAKECTDRGGLYNFSHGECFTDATDEKAKSNPSDKLEILPSDDDETATRKECINAGNVYNAEQGVCIED